MCSTLTKVQNSKAMLSSSLAPIKPSGHAQFVLGPGIPNRMAQFNTVILGLPWSNWSTLGLPLVDMVYPWLKWSTFPLSIPASTSSLVVLDLVQTFGSLCHRAFSSCPVAQIPRGQNSLRQKWSPNPAPGISAFPKQLMIHVGLFVIPIACGQNPWVFKLVCLY
ncbi:hypothetical protein DdX_17272 [Ditylenchus destructor]|uniref:Uncharacterized protein n=1 Tax=Ditylenchus destructor TaxID=166010 RepID=A0AAD4MM01_9BILA|nr:hypothetical protein DdX_17272 [Ditylenchus destructor]